MATSSSTIPNPRTPDPIGFVAPFEHKIAPDVIAYWLDGQLCIDGSNITLTDEQAAHLAAVALRH